MKFLLVDKRKRLGDPGEAHYAIQRLQETLNQKGIECDYCHFDEISTQVINGKLNLLACQKSLTDYSHIIMRGHRPNEYYIKQEVVEFALNNNIKVLNAEFIKLMPDYNKIQQMIIMGQNNIPYIDSYYSPTGQYHQDTEILKQIGFPLIYKHTHGEYRIEKIDGEDKFKKNIFLANNSEELEQLVKSQPNPEKFFIQKFVNIGEDYRAIMVGGKYLSGWKRKATGSFLTVSRGEYSLYDKPTPEFLELVEKIASIFRADYCAIDIIYIDKKPYVLEINMDPGFKSFETKINAGVDVAGAIIEKTLQL